MRLYFVYTMVQKKVKNDQKLKSRGPALNYIDLHAYITDFDRPQRKPFSGSEFTLALHLDILDADRCRISAKLSILTRSLPRAMLDIPPPRWPTFLVTLFPILKEGMGPFIVRRIRSAVPRDQKVTNSRHMMAPKLRFFARFQSESARRRHCFCSGPLRRRSSKFLQARRPRLAQEATMGKVTIFFFYLRGSFSSV